MSTSRPQLWMIAGPNGAGKSTLVAHHALSRRIPVVNPDDIAWQIDPARRNETIVIAQAGKRALHERKRLFGLRQTFAVETTLTGRGELRLMQHARECGYKVNLIYIALGDAGQSNNRVATRVRAGGHDVPEADILRRFSRSLANLPGAINASDRVFVLDNSSRRYRLLFSIVHGSLRLVSKKLPDWADAVIAAIKVF